MAPNGGEKEMICNCMKNVPQPLQAHLFSNNGVLQTQITPAHSSSSHHLTLERVQNMLQQQQLQPNNNIINMIETKRRQSNTAVLVAQDTVARRMKEKDEKLKLAVRQTNSLRTQITGLREELLAWQVKAMRNQHKISALQSELLAKENEEGSGDSDDAVSAAYVDHERTRARGLEGICRECEDRKAVVVLMPCMHLCLCAECNEEVAPVPCHICRCFRTGCFRIILS